MPHAILLALIIAQANFKHDDAIAGVVIDEMKNPLEGIEVFLASGTNVEGETRVISATKTDAKGEFAFPRPGDQDLGGFLGALQIWTFDLQKGLNGRFVFPSAKISRQTIVCGSTVERVIRLKGPGDKPLAGAAIAPRSAFLSTETGEIHASEIPDVLFDRMRRTTNDEGKAALFPFQRSMKYCEVAIDSPETARQVLGIIEPSQDNMMEWKIEPAGALSGKIVDESAAPIAGRAVMIWSQSERGVLPRVHFPKEPIRTSADGTFVTPDCLIAGRRYRVSIAPDDDHDGFLSKWIKPDAKAERVIAIPTIRLSSLRSIAGKAIDRQGRLVADVEVFQSGDGSGKTTTRTAADGSFHLKGYRPGKAFVFARKPGFRFHGQLIDTNRSNITLSIARTTDPRDERMKTLQSPVKDAERKQLARRLIETYVEKAIASKDKRIDFNILLYPLLLIDLGDGMDAIERAGVEPRTRWTLYARIAPSLAATDLDEATTLVESIDDADYRSDAFLDLIDALPVDRVKDRRSLIDRALLHARGVRRPERRALLLGDIAERLIEIGDIDRAKPLFDEGLKIAENLPENERLFAGLFAARLARVDYPAARKIVDKIQDPRIHKRSIKNVIARAIVSRPDRAERLLAEISDPFDRAAVIERFCRVASKANPAIAEKLASLLDREMSVALARLYVAKNLWSTDRQAAEKSFNKALESIDSWMSMKPSVFLDISAFMPLAEEIDPAFVPEIFWRAAADRSPNPDPRIEWGSTMFDLSLFMARYDREVALVLIERELAIAGDELYSRPRLFLRLFEALAMIDPRRAFELIEKIPPAGANLDIYEGSNWTRVQIAVLLARPIESTWRIVWRLNSGLAEFEDRDIH